MSTTAFHLEIDEDAPPCIRVGDDVLQLELNEIDDDAVYVEKARRELRETDERKSEACRAMRELLKDDPDLYVPDDDDCLLMFLRPCKFYPDSACRLSQRYYRFKAKNPKYCLGITPQEVRPVFEDGIVKFVPTRCPNGERIMVINPGASWNTKKITITDIIRAVIMVVEVPMLEPRTQISGVHIVIDMRGLSLSHIAQFTPRLAQIILEFVQGCVPLRLKTINIVNQSFIFNMLYAIFKPFIGEKLKKRIFFHGTDWTTLQKLIPRESSFKAHGGTIDDYPGKLLADLLEEYESEFKKASAFGYVKEAKDTKSL